MIAKAFSDLSEDLSFGLDVIVRAKWALTAAVLVLMLWAPGEIGQLRVQILAWLVIAIQTFYLHAQRLKRRPVPESLVYTASAVDLAMITILIALQGGFNSNLYIFYFPVIIAFSVAFRPETTSVFTFTALAAYATVCLLDLAAGGIGDRELQVLATRLIALAAVAFCGALYWRIERERRVAAGELHDDRDDPRPLAPVRGVQ